MKRQLPTFQDAVCDLQVFVPGGEPFFRRIALSAYEQSIIWVLRNTVIDRKLNTQVRIAGGWMRDKLLGRENADVDVAVDNMSGVQFAEEVNKFLSTFDVEMSHIGVIAANPDQSKHLEAATVRVLGQWIDFVHLRSEKYVDNSRIPDVSLGTPEEDARRRDFTMNALFYNITTDVIEDFTGQGIDDLNAGIVRTPIDPQITFMDDPLRVFRAVRFSSRFGFSVTDDIRKAASNSDVQAALKVKVSRERIGIEVDGMLSGPRPASSIRMLHSLNLAHIAFGIPPLPNGCTIIGHFALPATTSFPEYASSTDPRLSDTNAFPPEYLTKVRTGSFLDSDPNEFPVDWQVVGLTIVNSLDFLAKVQENVFEVESCKGAPETSLDYVSWLPLDPEERRLLTLACQLLPLAHISKKSAKGKVESMPAIILLEALKRPQRDCNAVMSLINSALAFGSQVLASEGPNRLESSLILKNLAREKWKSALLLAKAFCILPILIRMQYAQGRSVAQPYTHFATGENETIEEIPHCDIAIEMEKIRSILHKFDILEDRFHEWGIMGCWNWKPLLTGMDVKSAAGGNISGRAIGILMDELTKWTLLHPTATRDEAFNYIQAYAVANPVEA